MSRIVRGTAAFTLAFGAAACQPTPETITSVYDTAPVQARPIEVSVEAAGVIEPEKTFEVKSKASGEILAVHADTGDIVAAGALLVEVDKRTPRNQLAEAEASLIAARARRNIAETQMHRARTLHESGTLTQADYEQTQLEFANAEAMVVSAQVAVENARISLDDTDVRAPITGTIIEKHVEPGAVISSPTQAVSDGTVLMRMANLSTVQVRTRVDETDIGKIRPGMPTRVVVAAYPNQPFDGEVLKIEPQAVMEQNVTMFAVLIRLDNPEGLLKPGMNAEVLIRIADRESVSVVPTMALRTEMDIPVTAAMLGLAEQELRSRLEAAGTFRSGGRGASGGNVLSLGGRQIELPEGVDAEQLAGLMARMRSGGELSSEERALLQRTFEQGRGGARGPPEQGGFGGGQPRAGGGGSPGAGGAFFAGPGGGFIVAGGPQEAGGGAARPANVTDYQFGGDYWVVAVRGGELVPVAVRTGLTDLEYSEILAGLETDDRVLLLPSTSLFEQQERLQQFISERFTTTPFQQQQQRMPGFR